MESRRQHKSSGDIFSFHSQDQDSEFEFGCVTPDLPSSKSSPADHLFCNGKLLPHVFPCQSASPRTDIARANSRTSSISSKDSLVSSRSNSTSSRSSSCSSARTSSSDNSERMRAWTTMQAKVVAKTAITRDGYLANRPVLAQPYGNSQRWQFITPAPVLSREPSRRRRAGAAVQDDQLRQKKVAVEKRRAKPGIGWRFFRLFMSACRECHAMEPSRKENIKSG
ncbi:hypothetical protein VitviT2T_029525 [Vitis vinifera]|uniref:Uncharacterized protein n=2 Tax=Vitis vinifera TaxID=29760 RepID=A5BP40_VITVI|nr:uncharacterized protein LOC104877505 [Vitis vinifera]RVW14084.1 hypothetical protein CK203_089309 [Vitis vinifera]RVW79336.1 hypothetical protein CK203_040869 [Vitis vinifera]WKA12101.1 hypothetical protein VitviT2T_029525 [Vitis vinifera]CAN70386.1 hypothetical protein VITISV_029656 [Vitis vinifera]|eukprot:XP_010644180.1 PREDICTED: uncharacterized protein LOC104877505 [Vitis vinifera]